MSLFISARICCSVAPHKCLPGCLSESVIYITCPRDALPYARQASGLTYRFRRSSDVWRLGQRGRPSPMPHGAQRDAFEQRVDAQYVHLCSEVAEHTRNLCVREKLFLIFLVGSKRLIEPIQSGMSQELNDRITLIPEDLARLSAADLQRQLAPKIAEQAKDFAVARIRLLLSGDRSTVLGIDETLAQIQNGVDQYGNARPRTRRKAAQVLPMQPDQSFTGPILLFLRWRKTGRPTERDIAGDSACERHRNASRGRRNRGAVDGIRRNGRLAAQTEAGL